MKRLALVGAHPDDCDILGSGLAMRYRERGWPVLFVSMANGDAGHHEMSRAALAARRKGETEAVAAMLDIEYVVMPTPDCEVMPSLEQRWELIRVLRRFEPNLVHGFEPDFITELSRHPGPRGMQMIVQPAGG